MFAMDRLVGGCIRYILLGFNMSTDGRESDPEQHCFEAPLVVMVVVVLILVLGGVPTSFVADVKAVIPR